MGCVASRTRYIDDYLHECIDDEIKQLVILGAGYDSRAYRFDDLKGKVKVFELDHPATQKVKIEKIKKYLVRSQIILSTSLSILTKKNLIKNYLKTTITRT